MLDCLDAAVVLVDEAARVSWRNRAAERLLAAGDGLTLRGDRLTAHWPIDNRRLAAALSTDAHATLRIARPSGRPSYVVHAHRLAPEQASGRVDVVLLVKAPEQIEISRDVLMNAYRLTFAEARVALAVVHGDRLADAASRLRISINTVKSTLQRVFAKTETRSQTQLVRLLVATGTPAPRKDGCHTRSRAPY
ncbi:MAG TPA: helix-turn-helix transcriptional regulator [Pseudomonadales bacterium]